MSLLAVKPSYIVRKRPEPKGDVEIWVNCQPNSIVDIVPTKAPNLFPIVSTGF